MVQVNLIIKLLTDDEFGRQRPYIVEAYAEGMRFKLDNPLPSVQFNVDFVKNQVVQALFKEKDFQGWRDRLAEFYISQYRMHWMEELDVPNKLENRLHFFWGDLSANICYEERNKRIYYLRVSENKSLKSIGDLYNLSASRIRLIVAKEERNRKWNQLRHEKVEIKGQILEPDFTDNAHYGTMHEWTIEKQYQEFNNEKV